MAEFKRNFTKSRMNKDLDERLVPNGEYRDAQNVEVLASDGSDVGTVQTCLGNNMVSDLSPGSSWPFSMGLPKYSQSVGSIADDKINSIYYFVSGLEPLGNNFVNLTTYNIHLNPNGHNYISSDIIVEYSAELGRTLPVMVDIYNVRTQTLFDGVAITPPFNQPVVDIPILETSGLRVGMEITISASGVLLTSPGTFVTAIPTSTSIIISHPVIYAGAAWALAASSIVDVFAPRVLNFKKDRLITGINIIDDMLFWTDNHTEPKKVNITRGKKGSIPGMGICEACRYNHNLENPYTFVGATAWGGVMNTPPGTTHTELVVEDSLVIDHEKNGVALNPPFGISEYVQEKHITVIKKSPLTPLKLEMSDAIQRFDSNGILIQPTSSTILNYAWYGTIGAGTGLYDIGTTSQQVNNDPANNPVMINLNTAVDYRAGDILLCSDTLGGVTKVKLVVTSSYSTATMPLLVNSPTAGGLEVKILFMSEQFIADPDNNIPTTWYVELQPKTDPLYELKFPKFAYRYKYEDGEYSIFSPFSEIAFLPGKFDYHPKFGYNLGMVNNLKKLVIKDFIPTNIPEDVVEVEILYKESNSPNIYTIRSFTDKDPEWIAVGTKNHKGSFEIKDDLIHAVVASNQLLRPWDNVPRKALGQEVTGNRLIYGNYVQNYNLLSQGEYTQLQVKPEFKTFVDSNPVDVIGFPKKSLKSMRTYQLGIVYKDIYGRETPVLSHPSAVVKIANTYASQVNSLAIQTTTPPPIWSDSFKYFIKEISNEYYNLAMDRWYDAEDEGVWLAFPSEDRNKVDEETTLILKRGVGETAEAVLEHARYKILAIENEAPDFIKTTEEIFATFNANTTANDPGHLSQGFPLLGIKYIRVKDTNWEKSELTTLQHRHQNQTLYKSILGDKETSLQMRIRTGDNATPSNWYDIINISHNADDNYYQITVTEAFGDDMTFTSTAGTSGTAIADLRVDIQKKILENKAEFDGRFFVKIHDDDTVFKTHIKTAASTTSIAIVGQKLLYYMGYKSTQNGNIIESWDPSGSAQWTSVLDDPTFGEDFFAYEIGGYGDFINPTTNVIYPGRVWATQIAHARSHAGFYKGSTSNGGLGLDHWTGGGGAVIPGNPTTSRGGTRTEGGFWFIDQEPTYRFINTIDMTGNLNSVGSWSAPITPASGTGVYGNYSFQHPPGGAHLVVFTSDTGVGAVEGKDEMDISWVGGRDWPYGGSSNTWRGTWKDIAGLHPNEAEFVSRLTAGRIFRFIDDPDNIDYEIGECTITHHMNHDRDDTYHRPGDDWTGQRVRFRLKLIEPGSKDVNNPNGIPRFLYDSTNGAGSATGNIYRATDPPNVNATPEGPGANDCIDTFNGGGVNPKVQRAGIEFIEPYYDQKQLMPVRPAIWETEPKEDVGLDIYYEIGQAYPVNLCDDTEELYIQPGAIVSMDASDMTGLYTLSGWTGANTILSPGGVQSQVHPPGTSTTIVSSIHSNTASTSFTYSGYQDAAYNIPAGNSYIILDLPTNNNVVPGLTITDPGGFIPPGTIINSVQPGILPNGQILTLSNTVPVPNPISVNISPGTIFTFTSSVVVPDARITVPTAVNEITGCAGLSSPLPTSQLSTLLALNNGQVLNAGDVLSFTNPDGTIVTATVAFDSLTSISSGIDQNQIYINALTHGEKQTLPYYNCYTFGNGVESNRIRDLFNAVTIDKGARASTTLAEQYKEERRETGLIFSGIYNSMSGINRLNQFVMAENITKDLNPEYGSIQKLHTRDTDLVTLCEDKVVKVLANKDALFNADDTKNITATQNVLGNSIPFVGEYGISKNPESFASEAFRAYFTDQERGAVLRLSRDGLTPISDIGMKDWFADNLQTTTNQGIPAERRQLIGSYDRRRSLYNLSMLRFSDYHHVFRGNTISFSEKSLGWVSFKSFDPSIALSLNNEYYTGKYGWLWKHHDNTVDRNSLYSLSADNIPDGIINNKSYITLLFNDLPSVIKSFNTLSYEGSQSKVHQDLTDNKHYNQFPEMGWYVNSIVTDQQTGTLPGNDFDLVGVPPVKVLREWQGEFINKEGKWFNYIIGEETYWKNGKTLTLQGGPPILGANGNLDTQEFATQGVGFVDNWYWHW
jgi:hypothetical protein